MSKGGKGDVEERLPPGVILEQHLTRLGQPAGTSHWTRYQQVRVFDINIIRVSAGLRETSSYKSNTNFSLLGTVYTVG